MRRNSLVVLVFCGAAFCGGCRGASNNFALFSPQSTRVPAPGTKSFGAPDANYYSKPAQSGQAAVGADSSSAASSTEITWQPPRAKTAGGRAALSSTGETSRTGVEPASFNDRNDGSRAATFSDSAVRVVDSSVPASFSPPSSSLRLAGMKASEVKQPAGPPRATDAEEPVEITQLPPAAVGSSPKPYRPGSTGLAPAGPEPSSSPANNLRWRNRS